MRTLIHILLSCVLVVLQPCGLILGASSEFESQSERSSPDDSNETEADDSIALCAESWGRRVVRRSVAEKLSWQLAANVAAQSVTSRMALRPALDRRVVVERVLPLRC